MLLPYSQFDVVIFAIFPRLWHLQNKCLSVFGPFWVLFVIVSTFLAMFMKKLHYILTFRRSWDHLMTKGVRFFIMMKSCLFLKNSFFDTFFFEMCHIPRFILVVTNLCRKWWLYISSHLLRKTHPINNNTCMKKNLLWFLFKYKTTF